MQILVVSPNFRFDKFWLLENIGFSISKKRWQAVILSTHTKFNFITDNKEHEPYIECLLPFICVYLYAWIFKCMGLYLNSFLAQIDDNFVLTHEWIKKRYSIYWKWSDWCFWLMRSIRKRHKHSHNSQTKHEDIHREEQREREKRKIDIHTLLPNVYALCVVFE